MCLYSCGVTMEKEGSGKNPKDNTTRNFLANFNDKPTGRKDPKKDLSWETSGRISRSRIRR